MSEKGQIEKSFEAGTLIVKENQLSRMMYIIRSGKVRVFKTYMSQKITLAVLGAGEIFGELSFFDSEPRSASVEALTNCTLLEIDGEEATKQIKNLPSWVLPVLKKILQRFREADQKLTVLQSLQEYQKKTMKVDNVSKTIYMEIARVLKTIKMLFEKHTRDKTLSKELLFQELDDLMGQKFISTNSIWKTLEEAQILDCTTDTPALHAVKLEEFNAYLMSEIQLERFMMLSHASVSVLRRIFALYKEDDVKSSGENPNKLQKLNIASLDLETLPLHEEAIEELSKYKILKLENDELSFSPHMVFTHYHFQNILKNFDHTIIQLD